MLRQAAAYTGLPPQYFSFSSDNPASAEAIEYSETRLIRKCEAIAVRIGESWEQAIRIAKLVMGQTLAEDDFRMEAVWRDPATPTRAAVADATTKLLGAGAITVEQARRDLGYTPEEIRQMSEDDRNSPLGQMTAMYSNSPQETPDEPEPDGGEDVN